MIAATLKILETLYHVNLKTTTISDVRLGVFETIIKLSNGSAGLATTLMNTADHSYRINREASRFTSGYIVGENLYDLFYTAPETKIVQTLRIAALNALSKNFLINYRKVSGTDPFDLINFDNAKTVTVVGAFKSYIEKLSPRDLKLNVLELDEDAIQDPYKKHYVPAAKASEILPLSDVVIITGFTLVNNTLNDLLPYVKPDAQVTVVGPSSSFVPDVLFENGVGIMGAIEILDYEKTAKLVGEGASGFHFFDQKTAQKICIVHENFVTPYTR